MNMQNEDGEVIKNKTRLVSKSYTQEDGLDYRETFALVVRHEWVKMIQYLLYEILKP